MRRLWTFYVAAVFILSFGTSLAEGLPKAPPNIKAAEARGLERVTADELKAFFPGTVVSQKGMGKKDSSMRYTYKPDGSLEGEGLQRKSGKWRIDNKANSYCRTLFGKKGYEEECFAVFKVGDGVHYFDYDIRDGIYVYIWHRATE